MARTGDVRCGIRVEKPLRSANLPGGRGARKYLQTKSMSQPIRRGATGISEQVLHSKEGIEQEELALRRLRHAYREELDRVKVRLLHSAWRQK